MRLSEVLSLFDSPLSQEQCWSICYGVSKNLITKRNEDLKRKERIKYILNFDSLILTQRGDIEILQSEPNFHELQKDSELIFCIGNLICRCLDYGLDDTQIHEVTFQDDLAELIGGMVLQNHEYDEGIEDDENLNESWGSRKFSSACRSFKTLNEVARFCEARLLRRSIETHGNHYKSVSKALYIEVSELKAFLGHVLHDFNEQQSVSMEIYNGPELAKKYVKEWARLWINVMEELRQKTKDRQTVLVPEDYEHTPFENVKFESNEDVKACFKNVHSSRRCDSLPSNAEDKIFNFLRSRVSSHEEINFISKQTNDKSDFDFSETETNPDSTSTTGEVFIINYTTDDKKEINDIILPDKTVLPVGAQLVRHISDWVDKSLESHLDVIDGSANNNNAIGEEEYITSEKSTLVRSDSGAKKRVPLSPQIINEITDETVERQKEKFRYDNVLPDISENSFSPNRRHTYSANSQYSNQSLCRSMTTLNCATLDDSNYEKIGCSLTEAFKIRQEITRSEIEITHDLDVKESKVCFGCRKNKFSFFQRARSCIVCSRKYCIKCMREKSKVPSSLIDSVPPNIDISYNGLSSICSPTMLTQSVGNINSLFNSKQSTFSWLDESRHKDELRINMCYMCKTFLESIDYEKKTTQWKVHLELDI